MMTSADQLQHWLDAATLGVWTVELSTHTLSCSAQCKQNFGRPIASPFTYADLFQAIHPDERERVAAAIASACAAGGDGIYVAEYRVHWPDGSTHWISARGTVEYENGRAIRMSGVTLDVTAHKAASEAERAAREFSDRLIESSDDCIKVLDLSGRVLWVSPAGLALLGASAPDLVGRMWPTLWPAALRPAVCDAIARAAAGGPGRFDGAARTVAGVTRWWDVRVTPVCGTDGNPDRLLAVSRDISERKTLEEALRRSCDDLEERVALRTSELQLLGKRLSTVLEDERKRLARELHDELGQTLTALKLDTRIVRRTVEGHGVVQRAIGSRIRDMEEVLDATLLAIERIVTELRPAVLDELGFCAAADWLVQQFSARTGIPAIFDCPEPLEMPEETATALFRVLQEALTNVARHAGAGRVVVALEQGPHGLVLDIADDGCGIPLARGPVVTFGLRGMEERLRMLDGSLSVRRDQRQGTRLLARVPVRGTA